MIKYYINEKVELENPNDPNAKSIFIESDLMNLDEGIEPVGTLTDTDVLETFSVGSAVGKVTQSLCDAVREMYLDHRIKGHIKNIVAKMPPDKQAEVKNILEEKYTFSISKSVALLMLASALVASIAKLPGLGNYVVGILNKHFQLNGVSQGVIIAVVTALGVVLPAVVVASAGILKAHSKVGGKS